MASHSLIGQELGNYVIRSVVGKGGMGAVFAGEHRFLKDQVAIKVLHGSYSDNPVIAQRFFQEAKSAREIGHPSIVKILDFGQSEDGGLYLVMELIEGDTLSKVVGKDPIDEKLAARIGAQLAEGLYAAHCKGIIHRDLKPDNIFVVDEGVKIVDFGIAKVADGSGHTGTGAMLGTPRYMAPEQAKGGKLVGPHSDIYSLGVILFKMVTGRTPFDGDLTELIAQTLFEPPPRPSSFAPVSDKMEAVILRCLEKDPKSRPASMAELRDLLVDVAGLEPLPALQPPVRTGKHPVVRSASDRVSGKHALVPPASGAPPLSTGPHTPIPSPGTTTLSGSNGELSQSILPEKTTVSPPPAGRSRALTVAASAVFTIGIAAGGLYYFGLRPAHAPAASPSLAVAPAPPPSAPLAAAPPPVAAIATAPPPAPPPIAPPALATVVVRTTPPGATLFIDSRPTATTPAMVNLKLPHEISVKLSGYQPVREVITRAGELTIQLTKLAREHHSSHATSRSIAEPPVRKRPIGEGLD